MKTVRTPAIHFIAVSCSLFAGSTGWIHPAHAHEKVRGHLKKIDLRVGTITLQLQQNKVDKIFSLVNKNVQVSTTAGARVKLADLRLGTVITVTLSHVGDIVQIEAQNPTGHGYIKSIRVADRAIEFLQSGRKKTRWLKLTKKTSLTLYGAPVTMEDLFAGMLVHLKFKLDGNTIASARAYYVRSVGDPYGVIVGVDPKKRTFTMLIGGAHEPRTNTYKVADNFRIVRSNKLLNLKVSDIPEAKSYADLATATPVVLHLRKDGIAGGMTVHNRLFRGTLSQVDESKCKMTIALEHKGTVTLSIAKEADIRADGKKTEIHSLAKGMTVIVWLSNSFSGQAMRVYAKKSSK